MLTESQAKQRLRDLIQDIKDNLRLPTPLFYEGIDNPITSYLNIRVEEQDLLPTDEGKYVPADPPLVNTPKIVIDPKVNSLERISFTFFHEVTHHVLRMDDVLYEFLHELAPGEKFDLAKEAYCNIGAAEFLIPKADIQNFIERRGFSIQLIPDLEDKYNASKPAICIQLAQCANHKCIVVVCEYGSMPTKSQRQLALNFNVWKNSHQLYIFYASPSPSFKYYIGRYIPVPKNHLLFEAYDKKCFVKGRDRILFKNRDGWPVQCEAVFYKGRVYGVFNQSEPALPTSLQPKLFDL